MNVHCVLFTAFLVIVNASKMRALQSAEISRGHQVSVNIEI